MKRIIHLIVNTTDPTLQAIIQAQSEMPDLQITIVSAQNLPESTFSPTISILALPAAKGHALDSSILPHSHQLLEYDGFMDLIFESDLIVDW